MWVQHVVTWVRAKVFDKLFAVRFSETFEVGVKYKDVILLGYSQKLVLVNSVAIGVVR